MKFSLLAIAALLFPLSIQAQSHYIYYEGLAVEKHIVEGKNKYGFVDEKQKLVIPCIYDSVLKPFYQGLSPVIKNGKAGIINTKGKTVLPFEYKNIGSINKTFIAAQDFSGKWGFIDMKGKIILPFEYDNYKIAPKNRLILQRKGKWGMMTLNGDVIVDFKYRDITHIAHKHYRKIPLNTWQVKAFTTNKLIFSVQYDSLYYMGDGLYRFCMRGKYGIINAQQQEITTEEFIRIDSAAWGKILVKKEEGWGVIDPKGNQVIPCLYKRIHLDSLGIRVQQNDGRWALYSSTGSQLSDFRYGYIYRSHEGYFKAYTWDYWYGFLNTKGMASVPFIFKDVSDFKNGAAVVKRRLPAANGETRAVIDYEGNYIIESERFHWYEYGLLGVKNEKPYWILNLSMYQDVKRLDPEYVAIKESGVWGVCNMKGEIIIKPEYDSISSVSKDGLFVVHKKGKVGVCNKWGDFFIPLTNQFQHIFCFYEGRAKVMIKGLYGYIDQYGNVWISPQYAKCGNFSEGRVAIMIRNKWGFMDNEENLKVQPHYQSVTPFRNGASIVTKDGLYNFVNRDGKELHSLFLNNVIELPSGNFLLIRENAFGLASKEGKEILAVRFDDIQEIDNGYYLVRKDEFWSLYDNQLNLVIPAVNEGLEVFPKDNLILSGSKGHPEDMRLD